jgi:Family of unknown function (DUF6812)
MTDTAAMHFRRERVRIETQRHELEGTLQLPNEGYRSRTTDFLNAHERDFLALTDVTVRWLDDSRAPEHHEFLALATPHVVMVIELEDLGVMDEPAPVPLVPSIPPPS